MSEQRGAIPRFDPSRVDELSRDEATALYGALSQLGYGPQMRTPENVKDAWGEVEELAMQAGVDGKRWIEAVTKFWRVANLASELVP